MKNAFAVTAVSRAFPWPGRLLGFLLVAIAVTTCVGVSPAFARIDLPSLCGEYRAMVPEPEIYGYYARSASVTVNRWGHLPGGVRVVAQPQGWSFANTMMTWWGCYVTFSDADGNHDISGDYVGSPYSGDWLFNNLGNVTTPITLQVTVYMACSNYHPMSPSDPVYPAWLACWVSEAWVEGLDSVPNPVISKPETSPYEAKVGDPVEFDGSTSHDPDNGTEAGAGITDYKWEFQKPDGTTETKSGLDMSTVDYVWDTPGDYAVKLTVTDDDGETAETSVNVKVIGAVRIIEVVTPRTVGTRHTFLTNEQITLRARVDGATAGVAVKWTVTGLRAASGITGFPTDVSCPVTTADGISTFSFTPDSNPNLLNARRALATGSRTKNEPVAFEVTAKLDSGEPVSLSAAGLGSLEQHEKDILLQEYVDFTYAYGAGFTVGVPTRDPDRIVSKQARYCGSPGIPYDYMVWSNLPGLEAAVLARYRGRTITVGGQAIAIPAIAVVNVNSGYRSPRYNMSWPGAALNSYHILGNAVDLAPMAFVVTIGGRRRMLTEAEVHSQLFPALYAAGSSVPRRAEILVEREGTDLHGNTTDLTATHIHCSWNP
jgi:hypothetical protein